MILGVPAPLVMASSLLSDYLFVYVTLLRLYEEAAARVCCLAKATRLDTPA
jgi:hypothetical protein